MRQREADLVKLICCDGKNLLIENEEALPFNQYALLLISSEFDGRFLRRMPLWLSGRTAGPAEAGTRLEDVLYAEVAKVSLDLNTVCTAYDGKITVLLYAAPETGDFSGQCRTAALRLASVFDMVLCKGVCFAMSPPFSSPRLIFRVFKELSAQFEACLFRGVKPAILPDTREAKIEPEAKSAAAAGLERRLLLKLVNYDFSGASACLADLVSLAGSPGNRNLAVFKNKLFYLMENASYLLSHKAGKDDCGDGETGRFMSAFLASENAGQLRAEGIKFIAYLEGEFGPLGDRPARNIREVLAYLHDAYCEPGVSVASVAERFGVSVPQLSRSFKKSTGEALSDYIQRLRTDRAKALLLSTELSIEAIAALSGFSNAKTLYRAVERTEGVTPKQYRKIAGSKAGVI